MPNTQTLLAQAYSAFNHRDIDSALALMSEGVSWPKASEGGRVVGKEEIRSYAGRHLSRNQALGLDVIAQTILSIGSTFRIVSRVKKTIKDSNSFYDSS